MKVPTKKQGNAHCLVCLAARVRASMKAPTKKQGNNVDGESFETTRVPQ